MYTPLKYKDMCSLIRNSISLESYLPCTPTLFGRKCFPDRINSNKRLLSFAGCDRFPVPTTKPGFVSYLVVNSVEFDLPYRHVFIIKAQLKLC